MRKAAREVRGAEFCSTLPPGRGVALAESLAPSLGVSLIAEK